MELRKAFGKNLQKYRKLRNLTQEALAEKIGLDTTSISSFETGRFFPSADNLQKIANSLNINIDTLFSFENLDSGEDAYKEVIGIINDLKTDKTKLNALRSFLRALL